MVRNFREESFAEDFADEQNDSVTIQPWLRNTGYVDVYGEGTVHSCHVQYETVTITKTDSTLTVSTMQIFIPGNVVITNKDKVTVNGVSPKIIRVSPDPDSYGQIVYT